MQPQPGTIPGGPPEKLEQICSKFVWEPLNRLTNDLRNANDFMIVRLVVFIRPAAMPPLLENSDSLNFLYLTPPSSPAATVDCRTSQQGRCAMCQSGSLSESLKREKKSNKKFRAKTLFIERWCSKCCFLCKKLLADDLRSFGLLGPPGDLVLQAWVLHEFPIFSRSSTNPQ